MIGGSIEVAKEIRDRTIVMPQPAPRNFVENVEIRRASGVEPDILIRAIDNSKARGSRISSWGKNVDIHHARLPQLRLGNVHTFKTQFRPSSFDQSCAHILTQTSCVTLAKLRAIHHINMRRSSSLRPEDVKKDG